MPEPQKTSLEFAIIHKDAQRQISYGVVMEPDVFDAHNHVTSAHDIEEAMTGFMMKNWRAMGLQHEEPAFGVRIIENAIAPVDFEMGGEVIKKGSWYMGVYCPDEVWGMVEKGELSGFSIGAEAILEDIED